MSLVKLLEVQTQHRRMRELRTVATVITESMEFQVCNKGCENTHAISMGNGLATKGGLELISFSFDSSR